MAACGPSVQRLAPLAVLAVKGSAGGAVSLEEPTQESRSTAALIPSSTASRSGSGRAPIR